MVWRDLIGCVAGRGREGKERLDPESFPALASSDPPGGGGEVMVGPPWWVGKCSPEATNRGPHPDGLDNYRNYAMSITMESMGNERVLPAINHEPDDVRAAGGRRSAHDTFEARRVRDQRHHRPMMPGAT